MVSTTQTACVIGRNISVRGTIVGEEDLVVEGRVEGGISLQGHLFVAPDGVIEANVEVDSVEVHGEVEGDIVASRNVTIEKGARVTGNIRAPRIIIHDGAHFDGAVDMQISLPDDLGKILR